jgi:hypothetical protein
VNVSPELARAITDFSIAICGVLRPEQKALGEALRWVVAECNERRIEDAEARFMLQRLLQRTSKARGRKGQPRPRASRG